MKKERWKELPGYEGRYKVSTWGRVISNARGNDWRYLNITPSQRGYSTVRVCWKGYKCRKLVHRLVMETFRGESKLHVDHLNSVKTDNRLENLEYVTHRENVIRFRKKVNPSHRLLGAFPKGKKWDSAIYVNKKSIFLGSFSSARKAHKAYLNARKKYGV